MNSALDTLDQKLAGGRSVEIPDVHTFGEYLAQCAKVPLRGGLYGPFSFEGREPLRFIVEIIDLVLRNLLRGEEVTIDGVVFKPGQLKGATFAVGGGAQWGKTVLTLNFQGYCTCIEFVNFGYYTPDIDLLNKIVDTKFRPDVLDQQPWMSEMIRLGVAENESGKAVNRKNSYQVTDGQRKAFGHFCSMHKPPTTISLDGAALDEVDDIPNKNIGYVDGRMTGSPLHFKLEIGTQRVAGAGQNKRVEAGSFHVRMYECPGCRQSWNLEEEFPRIIRVATDGQPKLTDPHLRPEVPHDRNAVYYVACPSCGHQLDRDAGRYVAKNPEQIKHAHFSVRVSQLNISAISMQEFVGAYFAALSDPSGDALVAFYCDRVAIPNAGAAQPITQAVLDRSRSLPEEGFAMSLTRGKSPRVAGLDTGPRCWFWCDEIESPVATNLQWAELIASGAARVRVPLLMELLGIQCLFIDAGGEPDLTKDLCLTLNGLHDFIPPTVPRAELLKMHLGIGAVHWDGTRAQWRGIRCAAVLFTSGEARGIEQTVGFTQDGKVYPLFKCNRAESIQTAVNDFLTPHEGVIELVDDGTGQKTVRKDPRARLPRTYVGAGVNQALLDGHLLNVRRVKDVKTGAEDWIDGVENHLGLAKVYARLAATQSGKPVNTGALTAEMLKGIRMGGNRGFSRARSIIGGGRGLV